MLSKPNRRPIPTGLSAQVTNARASAVIEAARTVIAQAKDEIVNDWAKSATSQPVTSTIAPRLPGSREPVHVDVWLEGAVRSRDPGKRYAAFFLHHARLSASAQLAFKQFLPYLPLFCSYRGERFRCTGASRLGDVWLLRDHSRDHGFDLRVDVVECEGWSTSP
jgi:hypothetical protein